MANFTFNITLGLSTSDGFSLSRALTGLPANAKALLDDTFVGPIAVDFAPLVASIADPHAALLLCGGDGAKLKLDGVATFTAKAYKAAQFQLTPNTPGPSGVLDLEIEAQGALQRIQFLAIGDPA